MSKLKVIEDAHTTQLRRADNQALDLTAGLPGIWLAWEASEEGKTLPACDRLESWLRTLER